MILPPAGARDRTLLPTTFYLPPAARRILDLRSADCRWPLGEVGDEDFRFCAAPRHGRGSYCAHHASHAREARR